MAQIVVSLASDDNFIQHMGCTIASILLHAGDSDQFRFIILNNGISLSNRHKIEQLKSIRDFQVQWITPDASCFSECPIISNLSVTTYFRLLLPDILPDVTRILYLDSDMIVLDNLSDLWNVDLKGRSIAVCLDRSELQIKTPSRKTLSQKWGLNNPGFNAGLLLMNLEQLRENGRFVRALEWIMQKEKTDLISDQDGLNNVLNDDYYELPSFWNVQVQPGYIQKEVSRLYSSADIEAYKSGYKILHYIGKEKPWHAHYDDPVQQPYYDALKVTPWSDFTPPPPTIRQWWRSIKRRLLQGVLKPKNSD